MSASHGVVVFSLGRCMARARLLLRESSMVLRMEWSPPVRLAVKGTKAQNYFRLYSTPPISMSNVRLPPLRKNIDTVAVELSNWEERQPEP